MTPFSAFVMVRSPTDKLFAAMRDRMSEIVTMLPDIASIQEMERQSDGPGQRVVNRWEAELTIPKFLRTKLGAERVAWIDQAVWSDDIMGCDWSIRPLIGDGAIECQGNTRFESAMAGRGTRAVFAGTLEIDSAFMAGLVGPLRGPVTALVESLATTIIPANFRAAAEAAAKLG